MSFGVDLPTEADRETINRIDFRAAGIEEQRTELREAMAAVLDDLNAAARHYSQCALRATTSPQHYFADKGGDIEALLYRQVAAKRKLDTAYHRVILPAINVQQRDAFSKFQNAADSLCAWARTILELIGTVAGRPATVSTVSVPVFDPATGRHVSPSTDQNGVPTATSCVLINEQPLYENFVAQSTALTQPDNFVYNERFRGNVLKPELFAPLKKLVAVIDAEYHRLREIEFLELTPALETDVASTGYPATAAASADASSSPQRARPLILPPVATFAALRDSLQLLLATSQTEDELGTLSSFRDMVDSLNKDATRLHALCTDTVRIRQLQEAERRGLYQELHVARQRSADIKRIILRDIMQRATLEAAFPTRAEESKRLAREASQAQADQPARRTVTSQLSKVFVCCAETSRLQRESSPLHEQKQQLLRMLGPINGLLDASCDVCEATFPDEFARDWSTSFKRLGNKFTSWAEKVTVVVAPRK